MTSRKAAQRVFASAVAVSALLSCSEAPPAKTGFRDGPFALHLPGDGTKTNDDGFICLSCSRLGEGYRYHFQVFLDVEGTRLFLDAPEQASYYYDLEKPVPRDSVVYWRARGVGADGSATAWTPLRKLVNGYPKTER